jgi:hypothetical protein
VPNPGRRGGVRRRYQVVPGPRTLRRAQQKHPLDAVEGGPARWQGR